MNLSVAELFPQSLRSYRRGIQELRTRSYLKTKVFKLSFAAPRSKLTGYITNQENLYLEASLLDIYCELY